MFKEGLVVFIILACAMGVWAQGSAPVIMSPSSGSSRCAGTITFTIRTTAAGWHRVVVAPTGTTGGVFYAFTNGLSV